MFENMFEKKTRFFILILANTMDQVNAIYALHGKGELLAMEEFVALASGDIVAAVREKSRTVYVIADKVDEVPRAVYDSAMGKFPEKVTFLTDEFWIVAKDRMLNVRDRYGPSDRSYPIPALDTASELST